MAIRINNMVELKKALRPTMKGLVNQLASEVYEILNYLLLDYYTGWTHQAIKEQRLILRRQNKNEALKIDYILIGGIEGLTSKKTRKHIESMENRYYRPRVLKELFEV